MASEVVNSFNIILDTERNLSASSTGDDILLPMNQTPIQCDDNQFIRLTLQSFSMYKSWTNVNINNKTIRLQQADALAGGALVNSPVLLTEANYATPNSLAIEFATQLGLALQTHTGVAPVGAAWTAVGAITALTPSPAEDFDGDGNLVINFTLNFVGAHGMTAPLIIQTKVIDGDCFELLGSNRVRPLGLNVPDLTTPSMFSDVGGAGSTTVVVKCYYNCQLSSMQNIYLHTDAASSNIQTTSFGALDTDIVGGSNLEASRVLGKINIGNQFATFSTSSQMEYFLNLQQKNLTFLRLYIRDSHGRVLPTYNNLVPSTAGGAGSIGSGSNRQNTLGNRSWEAVVKVDIVQHITLQNNMLKTNGIQHTLPARFGTEPLNKLNYGESGFPTGLQGAGYVNPDIDMRGNDV